MPLAFDVIVQQLQDQFGMPRERAEAIARQQPDVVAPAPTDVVRDERILEKEEQREITKLFRAHGFTVRNLSQSRAAKQAPGIADLWVTHTTRPIAFWWESKRQVGGELSPDQIVFQEDCLRCHVGYGTGDRYAAAEYLVTLGIAERIGDHIEPVRSAA